MRRTALGVLFVCMACVAAHAQDETEAAKNVTGFYNAGRGGVVSYPSLREADVIYAKRIERIIDTREKKNQVMNWPKSPLSKLVYTMATNGEATSPGQLKVYRNDSLNNPMTVGDILKLGDVCETVEIVRPGSDDPDDRIDTLICTKYDYTEIKRWKIIEDWIFDKQRGVFFPRIVAIAPMYQPNLAGVSLPEQPMFYIRFDDLRPSLVKEQVFSRTNDAMRLSYDDFFQQRMFSSYITKESNDKDLAIKDFEQYKSDNMGALYESERIKGDLQNWESDLWEY